MFLTNFLGGQGFQEKCIGGSPFLGLYCIFISKCFEICLESSYIYLRLQFHNWKVRTLCIVIELNIENDCLNCFIKGHISMPNPLRKTSSDTSYSDHDVF
jgi:hypothetical protein